MRSKPPSESSKEQMNTMVKECAEATGRRAWLIWWVGVSAFMLAFA